MAMDAYSPGTTANEERNDTAANASSPSRSKIDVGRYVAEMERTLRTAGDRRVRMHALGVLQRWQFDEMLDDASRQRARLLVLRFAHMW